MIIKDPRNAAFSPVKHSVTPLKFKCECSSVSRRRVKGARNPGTVFWGIRIKGLRNRVSSSPQEKVVLFYSKMKREAATLMAGWNNKKEKTRCQSFCRCRYFWSISVGVSENRSVKYHLDNNVLSRERLAAGNNEVMCVCMFPFRWKSGY